MDWGKTHLFLRGCLFFMSQTAYLVSDILQIISDLRGESTVNTDASRIRAISSAEQDLAKRDFFRMHLVKDQSIGTGDGTTTAFTVGTTTYPMRMKGLAEVFVGGTNESNRVTVVDFNQYKNLVNRNTSSRIAYEYFDQANDVWKVKINPAPSNSAAVTASWFYVPPVRTLTAEKVVCENPHIIAYSALGDIYHGEDELQLEQLSRQEAENRIEELQGTESSPAVNQLYQMPTTENQTSSNGFGNY